MAKYKVCYSGYAYVEADSVEEAMAKYCDGEDIYEDKSLDLAVEVDEFGVKV